MKKVLIDKLLKSTPISFISSVPTTLDSSKSTVKIYFLFEVESGKF